MKLFKKLLPAAMALTLLAALPVFAAAARTTDKGGAFGSSAGNYGTVIGDGNTTVEIGDQDIIWLYENSDGGAWFGIDNSNGTFEPGSRLSTRWITQEKSAEWAETLELEELGNYRPQYLVEVTGPDGEPCEIPEDAALLVQVGAGQSPETVKGGFATAAGETIEDVALYQMGFPGGVDTFASVPIPGEIDQYIEGGIIYNSYNAGDVIGHNGGNGVILVGGICGENSGGIVGNTDGNHGSSSGGGVYADGGFGGITGSVFSGSASWLMALALVELGVIVGLVVGLFAKRKKN